MSLSQFHCTSRLYLDMHGLIFETSICYWQDQPGRPPVPPRRCAQVRRGRGVARRGRLWAGRLATPMPRAPREGPRQGLPYGRRLGSRRARTARRHRPSPTRKPGRGRVTRSGTSRRERSCLVVSPEECATLGGFEKRSFRSAPSRPPRQTDLLAEPPRRGGGC